MDSEFSIMDKLLKPFILWMVLSLVLLNAGMGFAGNTPGQGQDKIYIGQDLIAQTLAKSPDNDPDKDLDDFFEDDTQQDPLDKDSSDLEDFFTDDEKPIDKDEIPDSRIDAGEINYFINGSIALKTGYNFDYDSLLPGTTDHTGLSHAKAEIDLELGSRIFESWDFFLSGSAFYNLAYELNDSKNYTQQFLEENQKELELDQLFVRGSLTKSLDIKIGRQIVVWGKSDNIRVTDILNPLDLREPGMTDIEDLRLPIFMTRLDYYFSNIALSAYVIHEHRLQQLPVFGSPYYYLPYALNNTSDSSTGMENTEFALSLSRFFRGMDISFYLADIHDDSAYLNADNQLSHERISMAGLAVNKARGNFLYKAEAAFFDGIRLSAFRQNGVLIENSNDYSRLDLLAGIEYSGFKNTILSFEMADKWMIDHDDDAEKSNTRENQVQYALRVSKTFLHEVLELTVLASLYGKSADDGGFIRTQGTYDLSDEISLTIGGIFYQSGSQAMLRNIGENDSIFSSIKYSF
jgi:hypothetical protein